jgi:hypothetical protein
VANRLDGNKVMYKLLTAASALMTECGNRVYGPPLGIPTGMTAPDKAVIFENDGGPGHPKIPMADERFAFYCYGASQPEAAAVFDTLFDALHRKGYTRLTYATGVTAVVRRIELEMGPSDMPDPGTNWPRVVAAFRMVYKEAAA